MFKNVIHFLKYNNFTVLILAAILLIGSGVFAQTEAGQAVIGEETTAVEGTDNTLLLAADLSNFAMDYKIERIEADDSYYYVTYTYLDLAEANNAWQYQLQEKTRKVSLKLKGDLGEYLAEELGEERDARLNELRAEQAKASSTGETIRTEVTEYSGLIGSTLDLAARIFPNYEPVKKREIPSPALPPTILAANEDTTASEPDNLTDIYSEYVAENDPDGDNFFGALDNCPVIANSDQRDSDGDSAGDACDLADDGMATTTEPVATTTPEVIPAEGTSEVLPAEPAAETGDVTAPEALVEEPVVEVVELP